MLRYDDDETGPLETAPLGGGPIGKQEPSARAGGTTKRFQGERPANR